MRNTVLFAAGALLGSVSAGVHKMKLQKVPISEQLVSIAQKAFQDFGLDAKSYQPGNHGYQLTG